MPSLILYINARYALQSVDNFIVALHVHIYIGYMGILYVMFCELLSGFFSCHGVVYFSSHLGISPLTYPVIQYETDRKCS